MAWAEIIVDPSFKEQPDEVKQKVATNYFNKNMASDPSFKQQPQEVQDRVLSNFLNTVPVEKAPAEAPMEAPKKSGVLSTVADVAVGTAETIPAFASGVLGFVAGQGAKLGETGVRAIGGQPLREAFVESGRPGAVGPRVTEALTYQPRSQSGAAAVEILAKPFEMAREQGVPSLVGMFSDDPEIVELSQGLFDTVLAISPLAKGAKGAVARIRSPREMKVLEAIEKKVAIEKPLTETEKQFVANRILNESLGELKSKREEQARVELIEKAEGIEAQGEVLKDYPWLKPERPLSSTKKLEQEMQRRKIENVEPIESDTIYRGQPSKFGEVQKVDQSNIVDNILTGKGVFTTTDANIARTYGENVFEFKKPQSGVLDLTKPKSSDLRKLGLPEDTIKIIEDSIKQKDIRGIDEIVIENIADKFLPKDVSWGEVKDGFLMDRGITPDIIRNKIVDELTSKGFNWVKHRGGLRTGGKPHNVYIALKDEALTAPERPVVAEIPGEKGVIPGEEAVVSGALPKNILNSEAGLLDLEQLAGEKSGRSKVATELVRRRGADIKVMKLDSAKFIRDLKFSGKKVTGIEKIFAPEGQRRVFSKAEREAITLLAQKIRNPDVLKKIGRERVADIIKNPTPEILSAVKKVRIYLDKGYEFMNKNTEGAGMPYWDNYVTQIWDIPKNKMQGAMNSFRVNNPFAKKRRIPSIEEGINLGFKPKTLDITEILEIYDNYRIETHFNKRIVDSLSEMKFPNETTGKMESLVKRADKAPEDWVLIDHPALNRAKMVGELKGDKEGLILMKTPLKVHPEIAKELKVIFDKPFSGRAITALTIANAFMKKGQLSLSLFHGSALMESAASSGFLLKSVGQLYPLKAYRALRYGDYEIFRNMEVAKDAIRRGDVEFGALSDVQKGIIDNALLAMELETQNIPGLKHATKGIRKANKLWDAGLWDYIHNTFKLYAYEGQVLSELKRIDRAVEKGKRKPPTQEEINQVKRDTGTFVNDSFGGQNWDLHSTLGNPKVRQLAQLTFLSPDWTLSTLRQAGAVPQGLIRALATGNKTQLRRATFFWARSALYFNIIAQSINFYNTEKEYGKGRFTWDNTPGKELDIFIGHNPDGTERYLRTGKQFREVLEYGIDPIQKIGSKMSPVAREGIRQLTKHDPGSGFPTKFAETDMWSPEGLKERGISLIKSPIPFSLRSYVSDRPANFMFTWPTSKGLSNFKTRKLFKEAIKRNEPELVERIYISALENGLDAQALYKGVFADIKTDITYDNKKVAKKILIEYNKLEVGRERKDLLELYSKRKILTPEVRKELGKLMSIRGNAAQQLKLIRGDKK